jgi:hypothetical protein
MKEGMGFMVHREQAMLLLLVAVLVAASAAVGVIALSGTLTPATFVTRAISAAAPTSGIPSRISIAPTSQPGAGTGGAPGRATASPGSGSTTLVPSNVYTYPPDDHGHDGTPGVDTGGGSSGDHRT